MVILADDLGWGDVKAMRPESTLATPRIDSIAAAGMRFTDAHSAAAVCSPSRYAFLTGRYGLAVLPEIRRAGDRARPLIDSDLPTLGSMLQQHGYRTAAIGKWHLGLKFPRLPPDEKNNINRGFDWSGEIEGAPVGFGFDEFFGVSGNLSFHPRAYIRGDRVTAYPDQPYTPTGLLPSHFRYVAPDFDPFEVLDRLTEEAVAFIDRSAGQENPFFLYFALTAPHVPLIPESRFVGTSGLGYYGDFVAQIDWIVGQVLDALNSAGVADDTLLVFTSDNGSPMMTAQTGGGAPRHQPLGHLVLVHRSQTERRLARDQEHHLRRRSPGALPGAVARGGASRLRDRVHLRPRRRDGGRHPRPPPGG